MTGFRIGSIVRLVSGGPPLTVVLIGHTDGTYYVKWVSPRGIQYDQFQADCLEPFMPHPIVLALIAAIP